jgi:broad specificity phosphatase PhoE
MRVNWIQENVDRAIREKRGWVATFTYPLGIEPGVLGTKEYLQRISERVTRDWQGHAPEATWKQGPAEGFQMLFVMPPDSAESADDLQAQLQQWWVEIAGPGGRVVLDQAGERLIREPSS